MTQDRLIGLLLLHTHQLIAVTTHIKTMSTYATVPEVGEQSSKPSTLGFKKVVAGAAIAAFLLASLAAVAVAGGSAPPVVPLG